MGVPVVTRLSGGDEGQVTLFASADRLRSFVHQVLAVLPDDGGPCLVCGAAYDPDAVEPAGVAL